jgi:hypothetical protein
MDGKKKYSTIATLEHGDAAAQCALWRGSNQRHISRWDLSGEVYPVALASDPSFRQKIVATAPTLDAPQCHVGLKDGSSLTQGRIDQFVNRVSLTTAKNKL